MLMQENDENPSSEMDSPSDNTATQDGGAVASKAADGAYAGESPIDPRFEPKLVINTMKNLVIAEQFEIGQRVAVDARDGVLFMGVINAAGTLLTLKLIENEVI